MLPRRLMRSERFRMQVLVIGVCMIGVLIFALRREDLTNRWEYTFQDLLLKVVAQEPLPDDLVLVGIDETSMSPDIFEPGEVAASPALQLMEAGWPWSREVYALLIQKLLDAGARLIIFDLTFPSERTGDEAFASAIRNSKDRVIIGASFDIPDKDTTIEPVYTTPTPVIAEATEGAIGIVNLPKYEDNVVRGVFLFATASSISRKVPYAEEERRPSLSMVAAEKLGLERPSKEEGLWSRRFEYSLPGEPDPIPIYQIFVPQYWKKNLRNGEAFKDKIVLVGMTAAIGQDFHLTPFDRLSGPEIQLHIFSALRGGKWLAVSGTLAGLVSIVIAGFGLIFLAAARRKPVYFVIGWLGVIVVWLLISYGVFQLFSMFLPMAMPLVTWSVCGFAALVCDVTFERRERSRLSGALERYGSKDLVREVLLNRESFLQTLGGQRKEVAVLFCDLKGFTSSAEDFDPADLVTLLNDYFGVMGDRVFANNGMLDKFMGDALMAVWGGMTTAGTKEDSLRAVRCAIEMTESLGVINERRVAKDLKPWGCGIGVAQGSAIFGNIGLQQKMDLTVIGDTVNLASRLEGLTRIYGCDILIGQSLADIVGDAFALLEIDRVRVKGRVKPETLYFPYDKSREQELTPWIEAYLVARELYTRGEFAKARDKFSALDWDFLPNLATSYIKRCEFLIEHPPEGEWSGIWDFVQK